MYLDGVWIPAQIIGPLWASKNKKDGVVCDWRCDSQHQYCATWYCLVLLGWTDEPSTISPERMPSKPHLHLKKRGLVMQVRNIWREKCESGSLIFSPGPAKYLPNHWLSIWSLDFFWTLGMTWNDTIWCSNCIKSAGFLRKCQGYITFTHVARYFGSIQLDDENRFRDGWFGGRFHLRGAKFEVKDLDEFKEKMNAMERGLSLSRFFDIAEKMIWRSSNMESNWPFTEVTKAEASYWDRHNSQDLGIHGKNFSHGGQDMFHDDFCMRWKVLYRFTWCYDILWISHGHIQASKTSGWPGDLVTQGLITSTNLSKGWHC